MTRFAPERQRNPELLGERVVAGRFGHGAEVLAERLRAHGRVLGPAEQHELGVVVETRQLPQQVPDVGADAEIVQLPRVDADAHLDIIADAASGRAGGAARPAGWCFR